MLGFSPTESQLDSEHGCAKIACHLAGSSIITPLLLIPRPSPLFPLVMLLIGLFLPLNGLTLLELTTKKKIAGNLRISASIPWPLYSGLGKELRKIISARILLKLVVFVAKGNSKYVSKFQLSSSNSLGDMPFFVNKIEDQQG